MVRITAASLCAPSNIKKINDLDELVERVNLVVDYKIQTEMEIFDEEVLIGRMNGLPANIDLSYKFSHLICNSLLKIGEEAGINCVVDQRSKVSELWGIYRTKIRNKSMPSIRFSYYMGDRFDGVENYAMLYAKVTDHQRLLEPIEQEISRVLELNDHEMERIPEFDEMDLYEDLYVISH